MRKTSDFLKGMGKAFEIFRTIVNAVLDIGGNDSDLERILTDADLCKQIAGLVVKTKKSICVNYAIPFTNMIGMGKYDWVNENITAEHFPITGSGKSEVDFQFVHLNKLASSEEVLLHMEKNNLRPATLAELLAFGEKYPEIQREFPIVALGSFWINGDGIRLVLYLGKDNSKRFLNLYWFDRDWSGDWRFLAVRKV